MATLPAAPPNVVFLLLQNLSSTLHTVSALLVTSKDQRLRAEVLGSQLHLRKVVNVYLLGVELSAEVRLYHQYLSSQQHTLKATH